MPGAWIFGGGRGVMRTTCELSFLRGKHTTIKSTRQARRTHRAVTDPCHAAT
jgi:hypothetical protein